MKRATFDLTVPGWAILIAVAILFVMGVASVYVTDTHYTAGHDGPKNAMKQCVFALVGLVVAVGVLKVGYQRISEHAYAIFAIALLALIPLLAAKLLNSSFGGLTSPRNGAYRWIRLPGFQFQPSEFMKVAYLLALAWYLRYRGNYRRFRGLLLPFVVSAVPLTLILLEPDLGTVLLLLPVLFAMLFMVGAKLKHLGIVILIAVAATPFAWRRLKPYQRMRVTAVLLQSDTLRDAVINKPEAFKALARKRDAVEWAASSGYQLVHSKNAVGSGKLLGCGWGKGVYTTHSLLPDRHNDFVFSIIAHQWGFAGCILVLLCFTAIVIAGVRIASVTTEPFGRLLAVGVVALVATQVIINTGMAVGLMPITGMTLPFVSYGGSSLLTNFVAIALLVSVSQHRPFLLASKPFEFSREHTEKVHLAERAHTPPAEDDPDDRSCPTTLSVSPASSPS
ncbi:MAG: rod shape-determining protein RodA [Phycisphaerales bacterium]|nr:MAG: rod shape-determining protein RodA [Phycisphaerales bacterium]